MSPIFEYIPPYKQEQRKKEAIETLIKAYREFSAAREEAKKLSDDYISKLNDLERNSMKKVQDAQNALFQIVDTERMYESMENLEFTDDDDADLKRFVDEYNKLYDSKGLEQLFTVLFGEDEVLGDD